MSFLGMVNNAGADRPVASTLFGSCQTLSNDPNKYVTLPDFDALLEGMTIHVLFRYSNSAAGTDLAPITLSVNGSVAKPIYSDATNFPGVTPMTSWQPNSVVSFTYDGSAWRMNDVGAPASGNVGALLNMVYPIGSIYMSINSTDPGSLFGGTWEQLQNRFLIGAGTHAAASTGGAETHSIGVGNLPSHTHEVGAHSHTMAHTHTGPSHSHTVNSHTHSIPAASGTTGAGGSHGHRAAFYPKKTGYDAADFGYSNAGPGSISNGTYIQSSGIEPAGNHTHSFSVAASTSGGSAPGTSAAGTGNTGGSSAANTGTQAKFNTGATGSGTALDTMPPYLAVYMWKRVA